MKKLISGLTVGVVLSTCTIAYSSDTIQATLFPAKLTFNGVEKKLPQDYAVFNYNGHAYLPIRFIAENMNAGIRYDEKSKSISVNYSDPREKLALLSSIKQKDQYVLSIHSAKETYSEGDAINVWGSLSFRGNEVKISHGAPLLTFSLKDESGYILEQYSELSSTTDQLKTNNEYMVSLPNNFVREYYFQKNNLKNEDDYNKTSLTLGKGKYTIGLRANFSDGTEQNITTEIDIVVH
ncbi:copper amine oxidase N-terminal domain-containing protein [Paenibacillus ehimensis]|uniref:copper amine oxidase N-terminal domain-containing protein n=1 Tax=Paenibacillus ehimensis TaxID=79264 RepID=UPI000FD94E66|nr:copper amine oxidase N-terminal domain-containing protein [Paenibacillus ehimensis]